MIALILAGLICMILQHQYYHYLDGKTPTLSLRHSNSSAWLRNQTVVSDVGLALAFIAQTLFVAAISISSSQIFWRSLRSRGHTVSQIDALMKAQVNPFTPSSFRAAQASFSVLLLALVATAMSAVSIFAPGAIKVSFNRDFSTECSVKTLRNLTSLTTDNSSDYSTPMGTVLSTGTFIPPLNPCELGSGIQCSDFAAFANWVSEFGNMTNVFNASLLPQANDLTIMLSVQTWDMERSVYQAVNCTGVSRSYAVTVAHNTSSTIDVRESRLLSPVLAQPGVDLTQSPGNGNISFTPDYIVGGMTMLLGAIGTDVQGKASTLGLENILSPFMIGSPLIYIGGLGSFLVDGNYTWRENMTFALEEYAQNLTLSLLSGQILPFNNAQEPALLEDTASECIYTFTAYEYTPYRLFVTYGVAALATLLCVLGGIVAMRANGVEETMDFSRFLRAVLNERMYRAEESFELELDTRIKARGNPEGTLEPLDDAS